MDDIIPCRKQKTSFQNGGIMMTCIVCGKSLNENEKNSGSDVCIVCFTLLGNKYKTELFDCLEQHRIANKTQNIGGSRNE
jgi:hypothetical protein